MKTMKNVQQKLNAALAVITLAGMAAAFVLATPPHAANVMVARTEHNRLQADAAIGKDNARAGIGHPDEPVVLAPVVLAKVGSSADCCKAHRRTTRAVD